jgi:hypothetical protein
MVKSPQNPSLSSDWSILGHLLVIGIVVAVFGLAFSWLLRPTVLPNPAVASYTPPPATLLIPPPRQKDAPPLADSPALSSLAQAYEVAPEPAKPQPERQVVRKRTKTPERQETGSSFAWGEGRQQWNDNYRQRGSDYGWNDRQHYSNRDERQRYSNRGGFWAW